jgi:RimJ/RimL family protein N-acetyltransferase
LTLSVSLICITLRMQTSKEIFVQPHRHPQAEAWGPQGQQRGITVRPLQPADADLIHAMHHRLSPESLYYRFLQYRRPTPAELATVCDLDPTRGAGLVATTQEEGGQEEEAIVGLAYYIREAHEPEPTAELGIVVEDRFQAQGIGRTLWRQLQQAAQRDGLRRLRILLHPANERMTRLVQGGGQPYITKSHSGLREYLVALDEGPIYAPKDAEQKPMGTALVGHWRNVGTRLA